MDKRMCGQDADVLKVAVTAHEPSDNLRVRELVRKAPKPTVGASTENAHAVHVAISARLECIWCWRCSFWSSSRS